MAAVVTTEVLHLDAVTGLVGVWLEESVFRGVESGREYQTTAFCLGRILYDSCGHVEHRVRLGDVALDIPNVLTDSFLHHVEDTPDQYGLHPQFALGTVVEFLFKQVVGKVILGCREKFYQQGGCDDEEHVLVPFQGLGEFAE